MSHPVSIYHELLQAILGLDFFETLMFSDMRREHHHPHRSLKAWSGALLLAKCLNFGLLTHRSESVERIISPSNSQWWTTLVRLCSMSLNA